MSILQALDDVSDILDTFGIFNRKWVDWKEMIEDEEHLLMVAIVGKAFERVCEPGGESRSGDEDGRLGEWMRHVIRDGNLIFHGYHFVQ